MTPFVVRQTAMEWKKVKPSPKQTLGLEIFYYRFPIGIILPPPFVEERARSGFLLKNKELLQVLLWDVCSVKDFCHGEVG